MSELVPTRGDLVRGGRRPWEAPLLSVLSFRATAGTQQAGADNPQVASFTPGTPGSPSSPSEIPPFLNKGSATCDSGFAGPGNGIKTQSKGGVSIDLFNPCAIAS
jgi:hypothetical protein